MFIFELASKGGALIWILLVLNIIAIGIFFERLAYYRMSSVNISDFLEGIRNSVFKKNYAEAVHECNSTSGPIGRVCKIAINQRTQNRSDLRDIIQEAGSLEVPRLERRVSLLHSIAQIAPMLGLLGTILGMLKNFIKTTSTIGSSTSDLSFGIYSSMITTAVGLLVSITSYILYTYLKNRSHNLIKEVEGAGIEILHILDQTNLEKENRIVSIDETPAEIKAKTS